MSLQQLINQGRLWRGHNPAGSLPDTVAPGIASGYPTLDHALPFAGWPRGALSEILHSEPGQGELQLLLPALAALSHTQRYIVFIDPPWVPYAPALAAAGIQLPFFISISRLNDADRNWALEQSLRAGQCGAVLVWPRRDLNNKTLRRLQLAAEAGDSCGFLLRHPRFRDQHSPAALRLQLYARESANQTETIKVEIIKCRGRHADQRRLELPLHRSSQAYQG
jgi:hypothetical protein